MFVPQQDKLIQKGRMFHLSWSWTFQDGESSFQVRAARSKLETHRSKLGKVLTKSEPVVPNEGKFCLSWGKTFPNEEKFCLSRSCSYQVGDSAAQDADNAFQVGDKTD
jgi:hypothetical protein